MLGQELHPPIIGPQGFEQAVAVEEPPVVHRDPGLGKGDEFIIEPDKFFHEHGLVRLNKLQRGEKGKRRKGLKKESYLLFARNYFYYSQNRLFFKQP